MREFFNFLFGWVVELTRGGGVGERRGGGGGVGELVVETLVEVGDGDEFVEVDGRCVKTNNMRFFLTVDRTTF